MIRLRHFTTFIVFTAGITLLRAQEPAPAVSPATEDVHAMRQLLELQTLKIDALTQQVNKLQQQIESSHAAAGATPQAEAAVKPAADTKSDAEPEAPRAEAVATGTTSVTHVVAKGETLTSIARHYKTSVSDLLKANKIEDDRKLQIGQVLTIPATRETETSNTKKENE